MQMNEFSLEVRENILNYLDTESESLTVDIHEKQKNNGQVQFGISIHDESRSEIITPVLYLNEYYERHEQGEPMESVLKSLATDYANATKNNPFHDQVAVKDLLSYDNAKERIYPRLINADMNRELLKNVPSTPYLDFAVTYHIQITNDAEGISSVPITNELFESFGISVDELHEQAVENMSREQPKIDSLFNVMMNLFDEAPELAEDIMDPPGPTMLVVTNKTGVQGASVILSKDVTDQIAEKLGGDFYMLPSSVHEVLALPADGALDPNEMNSIICSVNDSTVKPEEVLSTHAYIYDSKNHELLPVYGQNHNQVHTQDETQTHSISDSHDKNVLDSGSYDKLVSAMPELAVGEPVQALEHDRRHLTHGR